jgi:DNA-binding protein HU-beta
MNKAELIDRVARDTGLTKADSLRVIDAFLQNVTKSLRRGEKVTLVGFGTFRNDCYYSGRRPQQNSAIYWKQYYHLLLD